MIPQKTPSKKNPEDTKRRIKLILLFSVFVGLVVLFLFSLGWNYQPSDGEEIGVGKIKIDLNISTDDKSEEEEKFLSWDFFGLDWWLWAIIFGAAFSLFSRSKR